MASRNVRAFAREGLPWLDRATLGKSAVVARWLGRVGSRSWHARGLGSVDMRPVAVDLEPARKIPTAATKDGRERFELLQADGRGELSFAGTLGLDFVHAVLGCGPPRVARPLGRVERGVLAAAVSRILHAWRLPVELSLDETEARRPHAGDVAITFGLRTAATTGVLCLTAPCHWLDVAAGRDLAPAPSWLAVVAICERASTTLPQSEWLAAAPGDTVVFTGEAVEESATPMNRTARIRIGSFAAPVSVDARGDVRLTGPFAPSPLARSEPLAMPMSNSTSAPTSNSERRDTSPNTSWDERPPPDGGGEAAPVEVVAAGAPVEVVAEIGRVELRVDELVGLARGAVLALGQRRAEVTLTVQGRPWARGELVNVDDELAVRLTVIEPRR